MYFCINNTVLIYFLFSLKFDFFFKLRFYSKKFYFLFISSFVYKSWILLLQPNYSFIYDIDAGSVLGPTTAPAKYPSHC